MRGEVLRRVDVRDWIIRWDRMAWLGDGGQTGKGGVMGVEVNGWWGIAARRMGL